MCAWVGIWFPFSREVRGMLCEEFDVRVENLEVNHFSPLICRLGREILHSIVDYGVKPSEESCAVFLGACSSANPVQVCLLKNSPNDFIQVGLQRFLRLCLPRSLSSTTIFITPYSISRYTYRDFFWKFLNVCVEAQTTENLMCGKKHALQKT